ncbi:putative DsbA family dithiol-disulfide isomerase [Micromonospora sp. Llam0]|uniref:mycothiol-dependent nitroreductase Rv2466c family protein n=1 Tax=Micromonospora sp. Llam0 TaxID=2485143 RepID=UPI000F4AAE32|nr:disulfide bond formation protein DsbA [Micromonospora sp. Llam0]ROO61166.1 putative DsbA family dithiol-disulfide isomerase [Micromonospora sp. Llam0]
MARTVDFWFDPSCPYTWVTSRWMVEAATVRPLDIRWHVLSLSVLNEHREVDPEGDTQGYLWGPVRVCVAVEQRYGQSGLERFFTAYGRRVHEGGEWVPFGEVLADAGLPTELAAAAETAEYDEAVRASHAAGIRLVGEHVGTPIVVTDDGAGNRFAFFGPVISRIPRGEEAGRLWDGVVLVATVSGFHELKGRPPVQPQF